jgi:hypothetical protein
MAEDFNRVFADNGGKTTISNTDYADGWDFIGDNPPEVEDFNSVMNEQDKKLLELKTYQGGVGNSQQSWQNVLSSRLPNVNYTNSSDSAIMVSIVFTGQAAAQGATLQVDGAQVDRFSLNSGSQGFRGSLQAIIPKLSVYKVSGLLGSTIESWRELK